MQSRYELAVDLVCEVVRSRATAAPGVYDGSSSSRAIVLRPTLHTLGKIFSPTTERVAVAANTAYVVVPDGLFRHMSHTHRSTVETAADSDRDAHS